MGQIYVEVTAEDVQKGVRDSCTDCPVALALRRIFPDRHVCVDTDSFYFEDGNDQPSYFPNEARWFIDDFDSFMPVEPFSFSMEVDAA